MPGQPHAEGFFVFDVPKLEVIEAAPEAMAQNILDLGEAFKLKASLQFSGSYWGELRDFAQAVKNMTGNDILWADAKFYAEGMGPGVPNRSFDVGTKALGDGNEYEIEREVDGISRAGIYRCGVAVTLRWHLFGANFPLHRVLGFNEDCVIQVNPSEHPAT